jgi:osmotically inducible lipoprotein OsmB
MMMIRSKMMRLGLAAAGSALLLGGMVAGDSAEARACKRLNKTEGAVIGAVAGGVLGNVIAGRGNRTTGTLVGAAAGGVAGHEIARTRYNRNCGRYRR